MVGQAGDGAVGDRFFNGIVHGRACGLVDHAKHGADRRSDRILFVPACQLLRDRIDQRDPSGGIGRNHGVANAIQRDGQKFRAGGGLMVQALALRQAVQDGHGRQCDESEENRAADRADIGQAPDALLR